MYGRYVGTLYLYIKKKLEMEVYVSYNFFWPAVYLNCINCMHVCFLVYTVALSYGK